MKKREEKLIMSKSPFEEFRLECTASARHTAATPSTKQPRLEQALDHDERRGPAALRETRAVRLGHAGKSSRFVIVVNRAAYRVLC